jgi:hypothetical protein
VTRWFVFGVVAAGLVLGLFLPLAAGTGQAEGFPSVVTCQFEPAPTVECDRHEGGGGFRPVRGGVYGLAGVVSSGQVHASGYRLNVAPGLVITPLVLCARPRDASLNCVPIANLMQIATVRHFVFRDTKSTLGIYATQPAASPRLSKPVCSTPALRVKEGFGGAAGGNAFAHVGFTNTAQTTCQLSGWPEVVAVTAARDSRTVAAKGPDISRALRGRVGA